MNEKELLEKNTELSNEVIKPILGIIDKYFFICFEDCKSNIGLMLPKDDEINYLKDVVELLKDRAAFIDNAACIISAYGKDCLRESQKAKEVAEISQAILNLAEIRAEQIKSALEYEKTKKNKDKFLKDLGIF